jgi:predicted Holliday junction resolvase-like endonuclease
MENKTPMQDLLEDLQQTKITSIEALNDINDKFIRETCQTAVTKTLDCIIGRIENELLPKEKELLIDFHCEGQNIEESCGVSDAQDYYNEKFNKNDKE